MHRYPTAFSHRDTAEGALLDHVDISPFPVIYSHRVNNFHLRSVSGRQDFVSALETNGNHGATNFPDVITISLHTIFLSHCISYSDKLYGIS